MTRIKSGIISIGVIKMKENPLIELRKRLGLSVREMAMLLEISPEGYLQAERGSRRDITNYEEKLKALGLLKEDEKLAEEYKRWKEERARQIQKEALERINTK